MRFNFFIIKSLGELGLGLIRSGQDSGLIEHLESYLQIAHQQGSHIGEIRTHSHIVVSQTPKPTNQHVLVRCVLI